MDKNKKAIDMAKEYETKNISEKDINKAYSLIGKLGSGLKDDALLLFDMFKSAISGVYKLETSTILKIGGAIVYLVSPIDAIPDFIPVLGFTDDATVIAFVIKSLKSELDSFKEWKKQNK